MRNEFSGITEFNDCFSYGAIGTLEIQRVSRRRVLPPLAAAALSVYSPSRGNLLGISIIPFLLVRRVCMKLSMENWIRIGAARRIECASGYLFRTEHAARLRGMLGIESALREDFHSATVDDSITNYRFLRVRRGGVLSRLPRRVTIFMQIAIGLLWEAVNCKIRLGIRLHLLVTRPLPAFCTLAYRDSPLIRRNICFRINDPRYANFLKLYYGWKGFRMESLFEAR